MFHSFKAEIKVYTFTLISTLGELKFSYSIKTNIFENIDSESMRINSEINVNQEEILYFQSVINYTWVHTADRKYISSRTLKVLATRVDADKFIKAKRGLLINLQYIKEFNDDKDEPFVLLTNGRKLPISRRQFTQVKKVIT